MPLTFSRLRWLNAAAGILQLLTGLAILGISEKGGKASLPWYTFFIGSWSRDTAEEASAFYSPVPKQVANFPVGIWSGSFLILSAIDHLLVVLPRVNAHYNRSLCRNRNPYRWAEYAVSASIMQVMIAQLCGVTDIHLLFTIAALMASCMLFGWQMEVLNGDRLPAYQYQDDSKAVPQVKAVDLPASQFLANGGSSFAAVPPAGEQRVDWGPFWAGCWPFLAAILVTACFFFQAVSKGDPPGFVWSLFFILTALYLLFAVNQWLQFKQVRHWRGFARAELFYIILSLTSKQLLAWITYGGTKRFE
ncbi:integral membrane [Chlorella sorokiniana]|uniref:Integral membrane n=1 Tax=Chlorella sorokiniana TaxID=3076 RepID=A0A2P6TV79_CHLSO|nr:integral membrane [Chlorella sorokiniana]|eukprot:PRW57970.1 integral membrane [Chlorella sorokiniana]